MTTSIINQIQLTEFPANGDKEAFSIYSIEIMLPLNGNKKEKVSKAGNKYSKTNKGFFVQKKKNENNFLESMKNVSKDVYEKVEKMTLPASVNIQWNVSMSGDAFIEDVNLIK